MEHQVALPKGHSSHILFLLSITADANSVPNVSDNEAPDTPGYGARKRTLTQMRGGSLQYFQLIVKG